MVCTMSVRLLQVSLWVWSLLDTGFSSVSLPDISDATFIDECVKGHNRARSSVSPPATDMLYMSWDEGLAITARAWARFCIFDHNVHLGESLRVHPTFPSVGENIWVGSPSLFNVSMAIQMWVNEKEHYNYQANTCTAACGHYTQVVWGSSYKVGCAAHLCPQGVAKYPEIREGVLFFCNYATAGNINSARPYKTGGAGCSGCSGDSCVEALCRDGERDAQKRYRWRPDWDTSPVDAPNDYIYVLVSRPVALLFTFIAAHTLHYFYPDLFCYE